MSHIKAFKMILRIKVLPGTLCVLQPEVLQAAVSPWQPSGPTLLPFIIKDYYSKVFITSESPL